MEFADNTDMTRLGGAHGLHTCLVPRIRVFYPAGGPATLVRIKDDPQLRREGETESGPRARGGPRGRGACVEHGSTRASSPMNG